MYKKEIKIALASLAKDTGQRPSDLLEWKDPDEWYARLFFDLQVMHELKNEELKAQKKSMRRR